MIEERNVILRIIEKVEGKENSEQLLSEILKRTLNADKPIKFEEIDPDWEVETSEEEVEVGQDEQGKKVIKWKHKSHKTKAKEFRFERKKKNKQIHQVYGLLEKLKLLPDSKAWEILIPKKALLKFITGFY